MTYKVKNLPCGWEIKKMTDVVEWGSGGTPKATEKDYYENGTIPWLVIGDLNDGIILESTTKITQLGLKNSNAKMIPTNTLLVAMYGSIGKLGITGIECCTNQAIAYAKKLNGVTTKYMYYYMTMIKPELIMLGKGGTQKNISQTVLNSLDVIVPSISEQDRIVVFLDERFLELDKIVETLQLAKKQLSVYRQSVLKDEFKDCNNLTEIKNMTSIITSGSRGWAKYYSGKGAKFIRIGNLTRNSIDIDLEDIQYVDLPENAEGKRSKLEENDVLVSITADLGSIGLVPDNIGEAYVNQHIAMIRFKNPKQGRFMAWYLRSDYGQKYLLKNKRGGGKLGLGLEDIREAMVPIVSDELADMIVIDIEEKLSVCNIIENTIDTVLKQASAMRQSILRQAFEGTL